MFTIFSSPILHFSRSCKKTAPLTLVERYLSSCDKKIMDNSRALIRILQEDERIELRFRYVNQMYNLDRQFSLNRPFAETLRQTLDRIVANVDKVTAKKRKKNQKKNAENEEKPFELNVAFESNGEALSDQLTCKDLVEKNNITLSIEGHKFEIIVNPPLIKTLKLPSSILAGFPVYPSKLELENCVEKDCVFTWYRSVKGKKAPPEGTEDVWLEIGKGFSHVTSAEDIGSYLKVECLPRSGDNKGVRESVVSSSIVEAGPGPCPFETRHSFTKERVEDNGFRVVTYNILADLYADSDFTRTVLHPYCPPYALAIDYRKQLMLKELIGYNADIICLQEVDSKVFDWDLEPLLSSLNFQGIFDKKGGQVSEGLACFFQTNKFELVKSTNVILAEELPVNPQLADIWSAVQLNDRLTKRVTERTTALQLVTLLERRTGRRLVVANTHLYFHPDADHVRLLQAGMGLRLTTALVQNYREQGYEASVIFCGDFNSCPDFGVLRLMREQHIPHDFADWSSNVEEAVVGLSLSNSVGMETACGTPPFTNYTSGFQGCLDYIFYEREKFQVKQVVPLPSLEEVTQHTALPSVVFPSDHIALIADLQWA